jgi:chromosome segregation ATPase
MQKNIDILKEKNKTSETNATKFKRKSIILEEKNKRLTDELGAQTMQFLKKVKEQNDLRNTINSLKLQNNDLFQKLKNSHTQIETLQNVCKNLREKIEKNEVLKENIQNNFVKNENKDLKSGKNIIQLKEKNISNISDSENDFENDIRYKTFSNLNDLLAEESDFSCKKENSKKFEKTNGKKKKKNNFKRYSFDLDYIFEINLNTYENFFC